MEIMRTESNYEKNVRARSFLKYLKGLYPRYKKYLKYSKIVHTARKNGATIGENVTMPYT
ncbi:MAG: hypothetical protein ACI87N_001890 [Flavobacteriales bacterium]|jgi:hypothetical protein